MVGIFTGAGTGFERGSGSVLGSMGLLGGGSLGRGGEQVFLNAANGNLLINRQDEFLVGRGPDVAIARTYNSLGDLSDDNGDNWRQSTDRRVYGLTGTVNTAGSTIKRVSGDGSEILYTWNGDAYVATDGAGAYDKLVYTSATNSWLWTDGDTQITEKYNVYGTGNWRIVEQADTDNNKLTFSYVAGTNKLDKVTTADGGYVQYSWDGNAITGIVTVFTDYSVPASKTLTRTTYGYTNGRLSSVTVDLTPDDTTDNSTYSTTYGYDAGGRVNLIAQSDGSQLNIGYDGSGRVTSLTQTVASGDTRVTTVAYHTGYTIITDPTVPTGQTVRLDYNAKGELTKITSPPAQTGAAPQTVQFFYESDGDVWKVTDQLNNSTTRTFDASGNALTVTDPLTNVTTRTYDSKNRLLTETFTASHQSSPAAPVTTRYVYDVENHLRYAISAEGRVTEFTYTATGAVGTKVEYAGHRYDVTGLAANEAPTEAQMDYWRDGLADRSTVKLVTYSYDSRLNLTLARSLGIATATGGVSTAEGQSRNFFTFDQAGRLISRYADGQAAETFVYDGLDRLIASTDVNGATTNLVFYDAQTKTEVTLANGLVQTSTYNKAGELIAYTESGDHVPLTPADAFLYDKNGRLRVATDSTGFKRYFVYDKVGRKIADVDHEGALVEYRYDAANRLVATIRYAGTVTAHLTTLADQNSNIEMLDLRPTADPADQWSWQVYDKEGRLIETIEGDGSATILTYDAAGRLVKTTAYATKLTAISTYKTNPPAALVTPAGNVNDRVSRFFYDKDGLLVGRLDGEGYLSQIFYDDAGQKVRETAFANATLLSLRASGTFNELLDSVAPHADDRTAHWVYDGQGLLRYQLDALDQVVHHFYNNAGQLTRTMAYAGSIAPAGDYSFANIKALVAASGLANNSATRKSWTVYDPAGRVAYAINPDNAVTRFVYDEMGQVIKSLQYATRRTTSSLPTLATMTTWDAANASPSDDRVTRHYYSDRPGEIVFTVDAEGYVTRFHYDFEGRRIGETRWDNKIQVSDATTIAAVETLANASGGSLQRTFAYDAQGRLTGSTDGEGIQRSVAYYANGLVQSETVGTGAAAATARFEYDAAGRLKTRHDAWGTSVQASTHYAYNGLGDLISVTDPRTYLTYFYYDKAGRETSRRDTENYVTQTAYNAFGDAVSVTRRYNKTASVVTSVPVVTAHELDAVTVSTYDRLGRRITETDAEGHLTTFGYNVFGDLASVARAGATTSFLYDRMGRLTRSTDAMGYYEQYTLNAFGDRASVRNKAAAITTNAFDRRGLLAAETLPMSSVRPDGTVQATSVTNKFEYDSRGNRTKTIEAFGLTEARTTVYVYDKADRLTTIQHAQVQALSDTDFTTLTAVTPTESFVYDARGNLIQKTDANGARTLSWYDARNNLIRQLVQTSGGATPQGEYRWFEYDAGGNLTLSRSYAALVNLPATPGGTPPAAPAGASRTTTHDYDKLGRVTKTQVQTAGTGHVTGAWNGSAFVTQSEAAIETSFVYDARHNVHIVTDANGAKTWTWFDRLNRKVAEIDRENHVTTWLLDANGNVTQDRRYATKVTGTTFNTATLTLPTLTAHADDRVTTMGYNLNGQRTSEWRLYIWSNNVDANGALGTDGVHGGINYTYNALGQVTAKDYNNGESAQYSYDGMGRLTFDQRSAYLDQNGVSVRPIQRYSYDGLNNLTVARQGDTVEAAGDRFTRYEYGAGGRLARMIDANGDEYSYFYDAAGNRLKESWSRLKADGTSSADSLLTAYDKAGRAVSQRLASRVGSNWVNGDTRTTAYDGHGDVVQRGLNGAWQEQFAYDAAGRLLRTNSGDGVWRHFVYDKAGNRTLTIESEGANLDNMALTSVLNIATSNGAHGIGAALVDGINVTIEAYDKRGMATKTRLPFRELGAANTASLEVNRTYNAYGELASESDARNAAWVTEYKYNNMGRLIEKKAPLVSWTAENGTVATARPTETWYYDRAGRMIGYRDANQNLTTRHLLAGTGYEGNEALVTAEFKPDGGVFRTGYDLFGDARKLTDEIGRIETRSYDNLGRLTQQVHKGGLLTDHYAYDLLGQRIRHWNSWLGAGNVEVTDYDMQGRVTRIVAFGGDATTTSYSWVAGLTNSGMSGSTQIGGWSQVTTYANSKTLTETSDAFGHVLSKNDLGSRTFTYAYDRAGRMTTQAVSGETLTWSYFNTGLASGVTNGGSNYALYEYDAAGNRIYEFTVKNYASVQNAIATYDALGRMTSWVESGNATTSAASAAFEYDLAGNVRRKTATHHWLTGNGTPWSEAITTNHWYRYDSVNRVTTERGTLSNGVISGGIQYSYDAAGQRVTVTQAANRTNKLWKYIAAYGPQTPRYYSDTPTIFPDDGGGQLSYIDYNFISTYVETYTYNGDGTLGSVQVAYQDILPIGEFGTTSPQVGSLGSPQTKGSFTYDAMGRMTRQQDWLGNGTDAAYDRQVVYNLKGQVDNESIANKRGSDTWTSVATHSYGSGGSYALGSALTVTTSDSKNSVWQHSTTTTNNYAWWDGAVQSSMTFAKTNQSTYTTTYSYTASGQLASVYVADGRPRTITYTSDMSGQVIRRSEADNIAWNGAIGGDPHEIWYRFAGRELGYTGNNNTLDTHYMKSIDNRTMAIPSTEGPFRFGAQYSTAHYDFDRSLEAVNSYEQGAAGGRYTVRAGDTLQGIAAQMWGDSSLWYKLAEANGLSAAAGLIEGQSLTIPAGVTASKFNASTFKPYDPAEAIGDTSPTNPKAPKKNKCGVFGAVLLVAIAVAVSVLLAPTIIGAPAVLATNGSIITGATGLTAALGGAGAAAGSAAAIGAGVIGGAAVGAASSIVSQGVGLATGIQNKFSWKQVALAGLSGGISGGLDGLGQITGMGFLKGGSFASDVARSTIANAASQGVASAVGLQGKFNWAGLAAAAVVGGMTGLAGRNMAGRAIPATATTSGTSATFANQVVSGAAGMIAGAAARSILSGTSFGDNVIAVLPDIVGATVGNAFVRSLASMRLGGPQFAQVLGAPTLPGTSQIASDVQTVVVTARRMNWLQKRWYDLKGVANTSLNHMEQQLRANAERSSLVILMRLGAAGAERAGFRPAAQILTHGANLTVGFQVGGGRATINTMRGIGGAIAHPVATTGRVMSGIASGIHTAAMADPIDVRNAVVSIVSRASDTIARGDSMAIGEFLGGATVYAADLVVGSHGAGTASRTLRFGGAAADLPRVTVRPAETLNRAMQEAGHLPAWRAGTQVVTETVPAGTTYNMILDARQALTVLRGSPDLGRWATTADIPTQAIARDGLSLLQEFKAGDLFRVQVRTTADQTVNRGIAGGLEGYRGGLEQIEFLGPRYLEVLDDPVLLFRR